jgi:hypothetical protein
LTQLPKLHKTSTVIPIPPDELAKIAKPVDKDNPPQVCQVPGCKNKHRGLGLCNAHHGRLYRYRLAQGKPERIKRDNSDIERFMLPVLGNDLKAKDRYCHYPECQREFFARGLCRVHHKRWLRWKEGK